MDINKINLYNYHCKNKHRYRVPLFKSLNYSNTTLYVYEHLFVIAMKYGDLQTIKFLKSRIDSADYDWTHFLQHIKQSKLCYKGMRYMEKLCDICFHDNVHLLNVHFKGHRPFAIERSVYQEIVDYCFCVMFYDKPMNKKLILQYMELIKSVEESLCLCQVIKFKCGKIFKSLHNYIDSYTYKQRKYLYHNNKDHYDYMFENACANGDLSTVKFLISKGYKPRNDIAILYNQSNIYTYLHEIKAPRMKDWIVNKLSYDTCMFLHNNGDNLHIELNNTMNISVYYFWKTKYNNPCSSSFIIDDITYLHKLMAEDHCFNISKHNMVNIYTYDVFNKLITNFNTEEQKEIVRQILKTNYQVRKVIDFDNLIDLFLLLDRNEIIMWIGNFLRLKITTLHDFHKLIVKAQLTDHEICTILCDDFKLASNVFELAIAVLCDCYCIDICVDKTGDIMIIPREIYGTFFDDDCVVCYEISDLLTACNHSVCEQCLIKCKMKCPYCRQPILSYTKKY